MINFVDIDNGKSPDTERIFNTGDAFVTESGRKIELKVTDIDNTEHTIMNGRIFGLIRQKYDADGENTVIKNTNTPAP